MSYALVVWEGKYPSSVEEATATYQDLAARYGGGYSFEMLGKPRPPRVEPLAAISGFVKALLDRWPDLGEPGDEDSPWADGPMINDASGPIICFALNVDGMPEGIPFVVEQAEQRGLVCFDPQGPPFLLKSEPKNPGPQLLVPASPRKTRGTPANASGPSLRQLVSDALVAQGYERKGRVLFRPIHDDFYSVVDTGELTKDALTVSPWVGLRHQGVEQLLADLGQRTRPEEFSATVAANVGYVIDRVHRDWVDASNPEVAVVLKAERLQPRSAAQRATDFGIGQPGTAEDVLGAIDKARKILDRYASLKKLPGAFDLLGTKAQQHCTLAVIYLLQGDEASVCKWLIEGKRSDCEQEGPACEQFRRFERNALARMSPGAAAELERQRQAASTRGLMDRLFGRTPKNA
jgi:hypothetical protein